MAETLIEPAVGAAVIAYLTAHRAALGLGATGISARVEDAPHFRVVESGGPGDNDLVMFGQQLTLEAFGSTLTKTSDIMRRAFAGIRALQHTTYSGVTFYGLRTFGAGLNREDPVTQRPRYSRTIVIDVRLQPLS